MKFELSKDFMYTPLGGFSSSRTEINQSWLEEDERG